ncbi:lectin BRA-3-like isoform X2 [Ptychodera flava]|uniref:lectin BRA-3-like isoform X2 n=1 Tax=Ptychodera flava TaxID=63121 RepID=UPI00396AA657
MKYSTITWLMYILVISVTCRTVLGACTTGRQKRDVPVCNVFGPLSHGGHEFKFYTLKVDWQSAKDHCISEGGFLAALKDEATTDAVTQYIEDQELGELVQGNGFWIGLNDIETEGSYLWQDETEAQYANWAPGEPNNNTKKNPDGQDCTQMFKRRGWKWDDDYCFKMKSFICEFTG